MTRRRALRTSLAAFAGAALALLLFCGCSWSPQAKTYAACSLADITTTAIGLEQGFTETSPLVVTSSTATAVLSMAAFSGLVGYAISKTGKEWPWLAIGGLHCGAAVWNLSVIEGANQ